MQCSARILNTVAHNWERAQPVVQFQFNNSVKRRDDYIRLSVLLGLACCCMKQSTAIHVAWNAVTPFL